VAAWTPTVGSVCCNDGTYFDPPSKYDGVCFPLLAVNLRLWVFVILSIGAIRATAVGIRRS
jgi:hypothetical protein